MANESATVAPHEPLICTADLPALGGRIGDQPEDFTVDEIPLFEPSGAGDHWYVRIKKRLLTSKDLLLTVARAARVPERELGCAGMKDKHAVTSQWISVPVAGLPPERWELPENLEILEITRHGRKLRTGQQQGNRFRIRLVDVPADGLARAEVLLAALQERGLPNYFGAQRFGFGGQNLVRAVDWLRRGAPSAGKNTRFLRKLYPSVVQSEIFNRYLTRRLAGGRVELLTGDVVRLDNSSAVFLVEDRERELPRFASGDIHVTGPMIGPKMRASTAAPLELERAIVAELGLQEAELGVLGHSAAGTRRDLIVEPDDLDVDRLDDGSLVLQFNLPSGSFATQVVRELTREDFWARSSRPAPASEES
ncbi:MAG TPA: tRNA pseudouridine(13) synthase TruD [Polyangiaceae bacterium]